MKWLTLNWTHRGLVVPYGDKVLGNIGSGNVLLLDSSQPLTEPMLTTH